MIRQPSGEAGRELEQAYVQGVCRICCNRFTPCRVKGPECANMDGLNFPFASYANDLQTLMEETVENVLDSLRSSGVTVNPVDPDKPLR